ncbi:hypothetical protein SKAU_G00276570 [Synaphobranchus kaupii]|uniref:Uncharacterized protein n=1 Tax=Synaphobranchus kaupii TaxID=118154 RepID=A0A9Q1F1C6_SYNKA|nr:hypothetical protein SKAU_G00276570 [Synaphobranchus kaupii]
MVTKHIAVEILYPPKLRSAKAKKKHKLNVMRNNPDTLYVDFAEKADKRVKNNLIFFTNTPKAWHSVICKHYPHIQRGGIGKGSKITVHEDEHLDSIVLNVNIYTNGTVLIQSTNEQSLDAFEKHFPDLNEEAEKERSLLTTEAKDPDPEEATPTTVPNLPCAAPASSQSDTQHIRETLALLELEFAEFRELTLARLSEAYLPLQQPDDQHQQCREHNTAIADLREETAALRQDNQALRAQLASVKEDMQHREKGFTMELQHLREQLQEHIYAPCTAHNTHTDTHSTPLKTTALPHETCTQPPADLQALTEKDAPPDSQQSEPESPPSTQTNTPSLPVSQPTPKAQPPSAPQPPTSRNQIATPDPQVVLLMDSNGKFIEPKKLFPGKQVKVTRCSNTARALELLKRDTLGSPNYVIVHTGTNDLHRLRQNTAHAVRRMAEKASREFPDSRVVISTLLPRTDVPPHVIRDINAEIARSCAALPNVHLAHHPTIGPWYLYDGLHLDQDGGSEANLHSFEDIFLLLKDEADKLETTSPEPDINAESTTTDSTVNTSEPPNTTPAPTNSTPVPPKYMEQMRETLALLEQDFTEIWELTVARLCEHSLSQQLRDEVCQVKRECRMALSEALAELKELQEDNGALRAQPASFKEDMKHRDNVHNTELHKLKEQLHRYRSMWAPAAHQRPAQPNPPIYRPRVNQEQHLSYTAVLAQPAPRHTPPPAPTTELGEIKNLLSILCSKLMG